MNRLSIISFLLGCLQCAALCGQSVVSQALDSRFAAYENVDCIIYFHERPDLSILREVKGKQQKGELVFQMLKSTADYSQREVQAYLKENGRSYQSFWVVNAIRAQITKRDLEEISRIPQVKNMAYNSPVKAELSHIDHFNSQSRSIEWGIGYIRADEVWDLGFKGAGVVVAGQDTGYEWEHSTLINTYRGYDPVSGTANHNYHWHDAIHNAAPNNPCGSNSPFPCDDNNHGTHTMGTMVGDDGNSNQIGVAPESSWISCRNMDLGDGTPATYMECFEWFLAPTNLNGQSPNPAMAPHVINNSWSCPQYEGCDTSNYEAMRLVIESLKAAGVVVVVSNGNSGPNCSTTNAPPAFFNESFCVGAINSSGVLANFSSRGPSTHTGALKPDVSAPGVSVRSAIRNNGFASFSGTSMAGPHVAGVVALMISANPNIAGEVEQIEDILRATAIPAFNAQTCAGIPGSEHPNHAFGYGIIDAFEAVQMAIGYLQADLLQFYLHQENGHRHLHWQLDNVDQSANVRLMRSSDLQHWELIKQESIAFGLFSGQYIDHTSFKGTLYYRLEWEGISGTVQLSHILTARSQENWFSLYPNPVQESLYLEIGSETFNGAHIAIYDMKGKVINTFSSTFEPFSKVEIPVKHLPAGIYTLIIRSGNQDSIVIRKRFVRN
jgi:serine protease AprX